MQKDKCKGCPYSYKSNCNGIGEYWSECYNNKKHKDFMNYLDEIDNDKEK